MLKEFVKNEDFAKCALLGTILADGSLGKIRTDGSKNGTNADLEITHTSKNLDYLKAVKEILEVIPNMKCKIREHNKTTSQKTYTLYRLTTNRHLWLTSIRSNIYDNNRIKLFRQEEINKFNDLSLLLLYLDDGTLRVRFYEGSDKLREARITFCLDSFTLQELQYFQKWLFNTYSIETHIYRHSKNLPINRGFRIWTNTLNTKKFMEIINKYYNAIPSMNYKFLKYYSL